MTTTAFTPTPIAPFQFQATLDGTVYNVVITWNVYRASGFGWYVGVYQENGILVFLRALVASPPDYPISMTAGYFASTLVFYDGPQRFVVLP